MIGLLLILEGPTDKQSEWIRRLLKSDVHVAFTWMLRADEAEFIRRLWISQEDLAKRDELDGFIYVVLTGDEVLPLKINDKQLVVSVLSTEAEKLLTDLTRNKTYLVAKNKNS